MDLDIVKVFAGTYVYESDEFTPDEKVEIISFIKESDEESLMRFLNDGEIPTEPMTEEEEVALESFTEEFNDLLLQEFDWKKRTDQMTRAAKSAGSGMKKAADSVSGRASALKGSAKRAKSAAGRMYGKDRSPMAKEKARKQFASAAKNVAKNPVTMAAAAAAAAAAGYAAYKRFMSAGAKACKGAEDRKACMAQYKQKARQAQINVMAAKKSACGADPKCKAKIDAKIAKLKAA